MAAADYFGVEEPDDMQDDGDYIDRQYDLYETDGDGRASVTHFRRVG